MKVIDFLTGLFKMFNLTTFVEEDGTIYVDDLDSFYANKKSISTAYDISEFVDVNSSQVDVALPYREVSFSYEDTDTFLAATQIKSLIKNGQRQTTLNLMMMVI